MRKLFSFNIDKINYLNGYEGRVSKNITLYTISTMDSPINNSIIFTSKITDEVSEKMQALKECLILVPSNCHITKSDDNEILSVDNPRKEYARILNHILSFQAKKEAYSFTKEGYAIGDNVKIGEGTIIEPFAIINSDVIIGNNCIIQSGVKLNSYTKIGDNCIIGTNSTIGGQGFGIERDADNTTYRIPHLGGVTIGNHVEIGALCSIASGTINATYIDDYVKIDDCAFIAHNCFIGKGTFIIANAEVSGSVTIGEGSWVGPSASIIQKINIGKNATIGIGAVVTRNIPDNGIVAGNPADDIEVFKKLRKIQKALIDS